MIRRTPIKKKRSKPRPGRLQGEDLTQLRLDCFKRDKGRCRVCGKQTIFDAPVEHPDSFHMAHIKGKRMWGDNLANVRVLCGKCHRKEHSPKACPPKPK